MLNQKIGIMGGTFDPIHIGHLQCAQVAQEKLKLDKILFIPAGVPNFKQDKKLASSKDRLIMCELAIQDFGNPSFEVSDIEIKREGVTYTVDTLKELSGDLYFITGTDSAATLEDWHNYEEILKLCTVVAVTRKGEPIHKLHPEVMLLEADVVKVSSSDLRKSLNKSLLTPSVFEYIKNHKLYSIIS